MDVNYSTQFFEDLRPGARKSAEEIVPLVIELIRPASIVDVGSGTGTWLAVFREHGITDVCGVDGDYVARSLLEIPQDRFIAADLKQPLRLGRRFELASSLEVAEHLPPDHARTFIASLTSLAPVVLFSAAIPHQGGESHVNEQWPEYWAQLFAEHHYAVIDPLRKRIWNNTNVEWWYAQNLLMFVHEPYLRAHRRLRREQLRTRPSQLALVHPRKFLDLIQWCSAAS